MAKDIEMLREKLNELQRIKSEKEERIQLEQAIKDLEEEGTMKAKIKSGLRIARDHLRKKGQQFNDTGKKLNGTKQKEETQWKPGIVSMSEKSTFGTPKEMTAQPITSPLNKRKAK